MKTHLRKRNSKWKKDIINKAYLSRSKIEEDHMKDPEEDEKEN